MLFICVLVPLASVAQSVSAEENIVDSETNKVNKNKTSTKVSYVIETQVQGTQEQPNVIYITPWQDSSDDVKVNKKILTVSLPALTPLNPKTFKKRLMSFQQQAAK
jgi:viroplasmin and RNaseH domain-containing protein